MLHLIKDFRSDRIQRVFLNRQYSSWMDLQAAVPQGSMLGSLFSLFHTDDLSDNLI